MHAVLSSNQRAFAALVLLISLSRLWIHGLRSAIDVAPPDRSVLEVVHPGADRMQADEWALLPGLGPNLARRARRSWHAHPELSPRERLLRVPGIGARTVERLLPWLGHAAPERPTRPWTGFRVRGSRRSQPRPRSRSMQLPAELVERHVAAALHEDLGDRGDLTSEAVIPATRRAEARIFAKQDGVLCGLDLACASFLQVDPEASPTTRLRDGARFEAGQEVLTIRGSAARLLAAERTALNFLQQLSGVATLTARFVDEVRGTGAVILETRKTVPGLRYLQKYAVRVGGGENHRFGLFDRILLKENHFALSDFGNDAAGYRKTVERAVAFGGSYGPVCVEVRDFEEAEAAIQGGADVLLLDNFGVESLRETVTALQEICRREGRDVLFEASGGITLETAARYAAAGVDRLSVGALTHSAPSVDLSMLTTGMPDAGDA